MASETEAICGTHVTIGHVKNDIFLKTGIKSDLVKWSAIEIGAGKGFLSVMAKISFEWADDSEKLPKHAILKVPTIDKMKMVVPVDQQDMIDMIKLDLYKIHNCEISVYEQFVEKPPVLIPTIWAMKRLSEHGLDNKEAAYILMEDLGEEATHWELMMCQKLTVQQTKVIVLQLANLHSWSVINPDLCAKIECMPMQEFNEKMTTDFEGTLVKLKANFEDPKWIEALGEETLNHKDIFLNFSAEQYQTGMRAHLKHQVPNVLCHGDVHVNNMMFFKDKDGKPGDQLKALIDWQIVNHGNPMGDLCRLLNWLLDPKNRSISDRESMLQIYFDRFHNQIKASNQSMPFNFDQLKSAFWESSLDFGKWFAVVFSNFVGQMAEGGIPGVDPEEGSKRMLEDLSSMIKDTVNFKNVKHL